jgi:hypothetical protein
MMKILTYYRLSVATAILFLLLATTWMFVPTQLLSGWGLEFTPTVGLLGRRAAAFYLGIAVMLFMSRKSESSTARTAIIYGMITSCLLLAFLGVYEFSIQTANVGILTAVGIELVLVIAFMCVKCQRASNR